MPRYRVLETSYINDRIYNQGEEVEYDGRVSDNLEPIDKAAKKMAALGTPEVNLDLGNARANLQSTAPPMPAPKPAPKADEPDDEDEI